MLKEVPGACGGGGGNSWARFCDTCRLAACAVYCPAHSAYLCMGCDTRIHSAGCPASRHQRSWVCEACERAPAVFLCKADAASLCAACDVEVHSANPLARRHHRVPILPVSAPGGRGCCDTFVLTEETAEEEEEEEEAASWLLVNPGKNENAVNYQDCDRGALIGGEVEEYLDLVEFTDSGAENQYVDVKGYVGGDSVVPVKDGDGGEGYDQLQQQQQQQLFLGLDHEPASKTVSSHTSSLSHTVTMSSMDMVIVPESTLSDTSISQPRPPKGTINLFSGPPVQVPVQLSPMDREARVMRYREKKKTRKFEKTIRYASRKAYAESRPRIKGRFAKRTDIEIEVDQMFSATMVADTGYGIVPSL